MVRQNAAMSKLHPMLALDLRRRDQVARRTMRHEILGVEIIDGEPIDRHHYSPLTKRPLTVRRRERRLKKKAG